MTTAAVVCARFPLGDEAKALLREDQSPRELLDTLREAGLRLDALRLVAHAFPKRSAIWWGVICLDREAEASPEPPTPAASGALDAARVWVVEPTDEHRRAAMPAGDAAGLDTPAGSLAAAAYFSGGSLNPPGLDPSPPPGHLTAELVFVALSVAAFAEPADRADARLEAFLGLAVELTRGQHLWPGAPARS